MKLYTLALIVLSASIGWAQGPVIPDGPNATLEVLNPAPNAKLKKAKFWIVLDAVNFDFRPDLATDPVNDFAVGRNNDGSMLRFGQGHIHGWLFALDKGGKVVRFDGGFPKPTDYLRFYGATGWTSYGERLILRRVDLGDLGKGKYRLVFQLQQNDHTGLLQATAPAFPSIASVDFELKGNGKDDDDDDDDD